MRFHMSKISKRNIFSLWFMDCIHKNAKKLIIICCSRVKRLLFLLPVFCHYFSLINHVSIVIPGDHKN